MPPRPTKLRLSAKQKQGLMIAGLVLGGAAMLATLVVTAGTASVFMPAFYTAATTAYTASIGGGAGVAASVGAGVAAGVGAGTAAVGTAAAAGGIVGAAGGIMTAAAVAGTASSATQTTVSQSNYNEAVATFGRNSRQARSAYQDLAISGATTALSGVGAIGSGIGAAAQAGKVGATAAKFGMGLGAIGVAGDLGMGATDVAIGAQRKDAAMIATGGISLAAGIGGLVQGIQGVKGMREFGDFGVDPRKYITDVGGDISPSSDQYLSARKRMFAETPLQSPSGIDYRASDVDEVYPTLYRNMTDFDLDSTDGRAITVPAKSSTRHNEVVEDLYARKLVKVPKQVVTDPQNNPSDFIWRDVNEVKNVGIDVQEGFNKYMSSKTNAVSTARGYRNTIRGATIGVYNYASIANLSQTMMIGISLK